MKQGRTHLAGTAGLLPLAAASRGPAQAGRYQGQLGHPERRQDPGRRADLRSRPSQGPAPQHPQDGQYEERGRPGARLEPFGGEKQRGQECQASCTTA